MKREDEEREVIREPKQPVKPTGNPKSKVVV